MVSAGAIYAKTPAGAEEVKNRKLKLPPKLRTMLILIDGTKPMLLLREEAETLGVPADFLEQLEAQGLVKPVAGAASASEAGAAGMPATPRRKGDPVERFRLAQQFMNDTAVNALGIKAFFFTLKLEKCSTVQELNELVQPYRAAIAKGSGEAEADVLTRRVEELLAG